MTEQLSLTPTEAREVSAAGVQEQAALTEVIDRQTAERDRISEANEDVLHQAAAVARDNLNENTRTKTEYELTAMTDKPLADTAQFAVNGIWNAQQNILEARRAEMRNHNKMTATVADNLPAFKQAAIEDAAKEGVTIKQ